MPSLVELRADCVKYGLMKSGNKPDLIRRLQGYHARRAASSSSCAAEQEKKKDKEQEKKKEKVILSLITGLHPDRERSSQHGSSLLQMLLPTKSRS